MAALVAKVNSPKRSFIRDMGLSIVGIALKITRGYREGGNNARGIKQ
jgi:hypothetical protein